MKIFQVRRSRRDTELDTDSRTQLHYTHVHTHIHAHTGTHHVGITKINGSDKNVN